MKEDSFALNTGPMDHECIMFININPTRASAHSRRSASWSSGWSPQQTPPHLQPAQIVKLVDIFAS